MHVLDISSLCLCLLLLLLLCDVSLGLFLLYSRLLESVLTVLCLLMSSQVYLALEGPTAADTREGLEAAVFPTVCDQIRRLRKRLATNPARIRLLT